MSNTEIEKASQIFHQPMARTIEINKEWETLLRERELDMIYLHRLDGGPDAGKDGADEMLHQLLAGAQEGSH